MAAASVPIGIELVFDARIACGRQHVVGPAEHVRLDRRVLDNRLDHQVGRPDLLHNGDPGDDRARIGAALRGEPVETRGDRAERLLGRARERVVERDPTAGGGNDLGDPAAHLPRSDDENVRKALLGHQRRRPSSSASRE